MATLLERLARSIDSISIALGRCFAWLYPILAAVVVLNVTFRYGFDIGVIELEEVQWHLYSAAFLMGIAYTYAENGHVRVDVVARHFSDRTRAWIELLGCLLFLVPFGAILSVNAFDFFWNSWLLGEASSMPSGLPARYIIKFILFIALVLLTLQATAVAARSYLFLTGHGRSPIGH